MNYKSGDLPIVVQDLSEPRVIGCTLISAIFM